MKRLISIMLVVVLFITALPTVTATANTNNTIEATNAYVLFLESFEYLSDVNNYCGNTPVSYAFLDINKDGVQELMIQAVDDSGSFYYTYIYTFNTLSNKVEFISNLITYQNLSYSSKYECLQYMYPRPAEWENSIHFSKLTNNKLVNSFSIVYDEYSGTPKCTYMTYDIDGKIYESYSITELKREEYINTCVDIIWSDLYDETENGLLYKEINGSIVITGYVGYPSDGRVIIPSEINGYPVSGIHSLAFTNSFVKAVEIPNSVKTIYDSAFYGCYKLDKVHFSGTKTQWDNIKIGDNNDYLLEASLQTDFDSQIYKHGYAKVIFDAINESKSTYSSFYTDGYGSGIIQDIDNNSNKELIMCFFSKNANDIPITVCSVYTINQNVAIPLIEKEELATLAGAPSGLCSLVEKDGKEYVVVSSETGGTSSTATRTGKWDLYSIDGGSITKITDIDYTYYRENGSIISSKSSSTINGTTSTYTQYKNYISQYTVLQNIDPLNSENTMTLEELLEYTNTLYKPSTDYVKEESYEAYFGEYLESYFDEVIDVQMPCGTIIRDGKSALVTWNAFLLSLKRLPEFKLGVDEKAFYQAILFDLISDTYSSVDYEKEMEKSTVDMVNMLTDFLVTRGVDLSKKEYDQSDLKNMWPTFNTYMMAENIKMTKEAFDALVDGCDKADECIEVVSIYAVSMQQGQNLVEALKLMSTEAMEDPNAQTLKESLDELVAMLDMTPLEVTHYVLEQQVVGISTNAVVSIVCDFILDTIKEVFPISVVLKCIKIADWGSNLIFPTSISSEQQYRIYALYHIECISRSALSTSWNNYVNNKSEYNAKVVSSCYDMFVRIYEHEIVECGVLAELLYKKGILNGIRNYYSSNNIEDFYCAKDWVCSYNANLEILKDYKYKAYIGWGTKYDKIQPVIYVGVVNGKVVSYSLMDADNNSTVYFPDYKKVDTIINRTKLKQVGEFQGWYYDEECKRPCFSNNAVANGPIVRYAKFTMLTGKQINVKCPVDVEVYNESNELCVRIVDNKLTYSNDELRVDIVDTNKSIFVPNGEKYSIKLTASDKGTMNYTVTEINEGTVTRRVNFYDLSLYKYQQFGGNIEEGLNLPKQKYALSTVNLENKEVVLQPHEEISENNLQTLDISVSVEGDGSTSNGVLATRGDYVQLVATPKENEDFIGWYVNGWLITKDTVYGFVAKESLNIVAKFTSKTSDKTYILADGTYYEAKKGDVFTYVYNLACDKKLMAIDFTTYYDAEGIEFLPEIDSNNEYMGSEFPNLYNRNAVFQNVTFNYKVNGEIICNCMTSYELGFALPSNGVMTAKNNLVVAKFKVTGNPGVYEINTKIKYLIDTNNNPIIKNFEKSDESVILETISSIAELNRMSFSDNYTLGDVDGDGEVSIMDATEVQLHIAKIKILTGDNLLSAETDRDGIVSIMDATEIQLFVARIITQF